MNVSAPIRRNAKLAPDAPAYVRADGTVVNYAAVERTVDALAHRLRTLLLAPGQVAAVDTTDSYRYLCVALGLARIGAAAAPLSPPSGRAVVAIVDEASSAHAAPSAVTFAEVWPEDPATDPARPPEAIHEDGSSVFALCPSSGTTSDAPKFVALTHDIVRRRIAVRAMAAPVVPGTRHVSMIGPARGIGLARYLRTLWNGCVVVEPNLDAQALPSWLVQSGVTFMSVSPIGLRKILECLPEEGIRSALAMIEVTGGALPPAIHELAMQRLDAPQVWIAYGSTETGPVTSAPQASLAGRPGAVGFPLPGVDIETVDAEGYPVPRGEEGMLRVRCAHAATGYVGDDTRSATVFRDGWVHPNDNGIIDADGGLRVTERTDDVLNVNGAKLDPHAIEEVLMTLADLREVAVFGAPDRSGMTALCAAVVPNRPLDADTFHSRCRERLGPRAPVFVMHLRALPRNAMGKVLRHELARIALEASDGRHAAS